VVQDGLVVLAPCPRAGLYYEVGSLEQAMREAGILPRLVPSSSANRQ
jgi:hypothetical protein